MTTRADYSIPDLGESENWGREGDLYIYIFFKCGCALFELGIYFSVYFSPSVSVQLLPQPARREKEMRGTLLYPFRVLTLYLSLWVPLNSALTMI